MTSDTTHPAPTTSSEAPEAADRRMMSRAMRAEMLDAETEIALARAWREEGDEKALHRLINAYTRLAIAMASKYRRYGAPMGDLTQEASVGLMKAASKFDPDRGVRFSTYAVWWIKASIQDFVMRNWSLVRTGSTSSQKSLFFNLRRVRARLEREHGQDFSDGVPPDIRLLIAEELGAPLADVEMMEGRLSGQDFSLNALQAGEEGREWLETLEDESERPDERISRIDDRTRLKKWIRTAMETLTERERLIIHERKLAETPTTLEALGLRLGLSKERVRQLEAQALRKMRRAIETKIGSAAGELALAIA